MTSPGLLSALPKDLKARIVSFLPRQFKEPDDYAEEEAWSGSEEAEEDVDCESDIAALSLVNKELDAVAADLQFKEFKSRKALDDTFQLSIAHRHAHRVRSVIFGGPNDTIYVPGRPGKDAYFFKDPDAGWKSSTKEQMTHLLRLLPFFPNLTSLTLGASELVKLLSGSSGVAHFRTRGHGRPAEAEGLSLDDFTLEVEQRTAGSKRRLNWNLFTNVACSITRLALYDFRPALVTQLLDLFPLLIDIRLGGHILAPECAAQFRQIFEDRTAKARESGRAENWVEVVEIKKEESDLKAAKSDVDDKGDPGRYQWKFNQEGLDDEEGLNGGSDEMPFGWLRFRRQESGF